MEATKPCAQCAALRTDNEQAYISLAIDGVRPNTLQEGIDVLRQQLENERQKVAGCSTAAFGYWKEGDSLHPDYECAAIHDVAQLYAKYAALQAKIDALMLDPYNLAIKFHETYERLAPQFGYETQKQTRVFDPESPNGKLMIAVCKEIAASPASQTQTDPQTAGPLIQEASAATRDAHPQGKCTSPSCKQCADPAAENSCVTPGPAEGVPLLPCPFCGCDPLGYEIVPHTHKLAIFMQDHPGSYVIECGCGTGFIAATKAEAYAKWNTRKAAGEVLSEPTRYAVSKWGLYERSDGAYVSHLDYLKALHSTVSRNAQTLSPSTDGRVSVPWINVKDRLPESERKVIAYYRNDIGRVRRIRAFYAPKFTVEAPNFEGDPDYDEVMDNYFLPEGWYECNEHEETHWMVDEKVTHWMPLPAAPVEAAEKEGE